MSQSRTELPLYAAPVLGIALVALSFAVQGRTGLNLADEGFLWHGAMRVMWGDVPIRDFQSYDPGRYYWSALWMSLLGSDGIVALRLSVALFQAGAFTVALLLLRRIVAAPSSFVIVAVVFLLWFFPRHKLFDLGISIGAIYIATIFLERPSLLRHFLSGLYVGLAAVFGRNHGLYTFIALFALGVFAWLRLDRTQPVAKLAVWCAGVATGYAPMLVLVLTQPGFLNAMADTVLALLRRGSTNLTMPVPWPWTVDYGQPWHWSIHRLLIGMTFVAMPALYTAGAIAALREKQPEAIRRNSVFIASIAVGIVYLHYAFARAGLWHLAHAIFPFLFALLSLPALQHVRGQWGSRAMPLALLAYSVFVGGMASPLYARITDKNYERIDIRSDTLAVDPATARAVRTVQSIAQRHMRPDQEIVFAPYWATMYGVLGQRSPVWSSYSVFADRQRQQRFIAELERRRVEWAVIGDARLDGRDDRRFSRTHPLIWQYFAEHYEPVPIEGLPADYRLLRRRGSKRAAAAMIPADAHKQPETVQVTLRH